jgi:hypothetical protein
MTTKAESADRDSGFAAKERRKIVLAAAAPQAGVNDGGAAATMGV